MSEQKSHLANVHSLGDSLDTVEEDLLWEQDDCKMSMAV